MYYSGEDVFKIRKALGLTQVEFGALIGVTGAGVHYIEKGHIDFSDEHKRQLREAGINDRKAGELIRQYDAAQAITLAKLLNRK